MLRSMLLEISFPFSEPIIISRPVRHRCKIYIVNVTQRESESVGEEKPALGIGVDDLDGLAVAAADDVGRPVCRAVGHVLSER